MRRRPRRRGGRSRGRTLAVCVLLGCVVAAGVVPTSAFESATVNRESAAAVADGDAAVVSLDTASGVGVGETGRLVTTVNSLSQSLSVTVELTGAATGYGHLVVDGTDAGDAATYALASGDSRDVSFDANCDGSAGESVTFDVRVEGDGLTGRAVRAVSLTEGTCGTTLTRGLVYATTGDRDLRTVRQGSEKAVYGTAGVDVVSGQRADLDGDGAGEVAYVNRSSGAVYAVDRSNETTQLLDPSAVSGGLGGGAEPSKSRFAVGRWNGSGPAVFLPGDDESSVYRVSDGDSTHVASASNGVSAVLGVEDLDGDGETEIAFLGGSAQLRYVDDDGSTVKIPNGGAGSNNGVGAGTPGDFDGDGTPRVPFVDGSNQLSLVTASGTKTVVRVDGTAVSADKAPVTAFDWDGDGTPEVVYFDGGTLHVADGLGGDVTTAEIRVDGAPIDAAQEPGVA